MRRTWLRSMLVILNKGLCFKQDKDEIIDLLEGKVDKILKQLTEEMEEASKNMQYETAAYLRDKIIAIENVSKRQKVSNMGENDIDVIGLARNDTEVCIEMFFIRKSKMIGREHYFFKGLQDEEKSEIMSSFIKQYYLEKDFLEFEKVGTQYTKGGE